MSTFLNRRAGVLALAALGLAVLSGCSGRPSVSGNVTFNGEPVDGGVITFVPEGKGQRASAPIKEGKFTLPATASPGKNKVEVLWNKKTGKKVAVPGDPGNLTDATVQVIPPKFNQSTTLTEEVKSGSNAFSFDLRSR
jgi:hypothetical protein